MLERFLRLLVNLKKKICVTNYWNVPPQNLKHLTHFIVVDRWTKRVFFKVWDDFNIFRRQRCQVSTLFPGDSHSCSSNCNRWFFAWFRASEKNEAKCHWKYIDHHFFSWVYAFFNLANSTKIIIAKMVIFHRWMLSTNSQWPLSWMSTCERREDTICGRL